MVQRFRLPVKPGAHARCSAMLTCVLIPRWAYGMTVDAREAKPCHILYEGGTDAGAAMRCDEISLRY
jgi:hypothetical protein